VVNWIRSLLAMRGLVEVKFGRGFEAWLEGARQWDGKALPVELKAELLRLHELYRLLGRQQAEVARAYRAELASDTVVGKQRARLEIYKGIGPKFSRVMSAEAFAWRRFRNTKQVGSMAGLTPTPNQSGDLSREQGIGKHGNRRVRHMAIELAWMWLRWQPRARCRSGSGAVREWRQADAPGGDRGAGAQAADRVVALPGAGVGAGRGDHEDGLTRPEREPGRA